MLSNQGKMVYCWKLDSKDDLTYVYNIYRQEVYLRIRNKPVDTLGTNKHFVKDIGTKRLTRMITNKYIFCISLNFPQIVHTCLAIFGSFFGAKQVLRIQTMWNIVNNIIEFFYYVIFLIVCWP